MKFAHLGDCHLGGWRNPELKDLNFKSFQKAIDICLKERVDFVLITGDLFDSAYPPIETLKETFSEFRRLRENSIGVFLIAGSHDYSASGKSFLEVLEKAGFCKNVTNYEERNGKLMLHPTIYKGAAIYGYPGKKSGLEIEELGNISLQDAPGLFKILMLHTAIRDAVGSLPIKAVNEKDLPKVDYLALSHLHITYQRENRAYSGPIFPNNLSELEELKGGTFYIIENNSIKRHDIKLKEIVSVSFEVKNSTKATDEIINELSKLDLTDKILILKLYGTIENGKISDIDFFKLEGLARQKGAFVFLKSTTKLMTTQLDLNVEQFDSSNLESQIIKKFEENNNSEYNNSIPGLIKSLQIEKLEEEKSSVFEDRLLSETRKILKI